MPSEHPRSVRAGRRAVALGITAAAAAAGVRTLAGASARRETAPADEEVRAHVVAPRGHPARRAALRLAPIGKWWTYVPAGFGVAAYLLATRKEGTTPLSAAPGAAAVAGAGLLAYVATGWMDEHLPQPLAPPGHEDPHKPVFPSGHTTGPGAVALTTAYIFARERGARPLVAGSAAAMLPLATAASRLVSDRHWASDIVGGYLAAAAISATCLVGYELARAASDTDTDIDSDPVTLATARRGPRRA